MEEPFQAFRIRNPVVQLPSDIIVFYLALRDLQTRNSPARSCLLYKANVLSSKGEKKFLMIPKNLEEKQMGGDRHGASRTRDFWYNLVAGTYPIPELAIIGLAAAIHLVNITGFPTFFVDEGTYIQRAIIFGQTGDPTSPAGTFYFHPFLVWVVLGAFFTVFNFPASWKASPELLYLLPRSLFAIIGVLDVLLVYFVVQRVYHRRDYALLASGMLALTPLSVRYLRMVLLDSVMLFFLLLSLAFMVKRASSKNTVVSGVMFGLGALSKLPALFFLLPFILLMLSRDKAKFQPTKGAFKAALPTITVWLLMAAAVVSIWPTYAIATGQVKGLLTSFSYESSRRGTLALDVVFSRIVERDVVLLLAFAGLAYGVWKRDILGGIFSLFYLGTFLAGDLPVSSYYLVPVLPFLGLLAARLVIDISQILSHQMSKLNIMVERAGVKAIGGSLLIALAVSGFLTSSQAPTTSQVAAMNYVIQNAPDRALVISNSAYSWVIQQSRPNLIVFDWYSAPYNSLPSHSPETFLIVDPGFSMVASYIPNLQVLYNQTNTTAVFSQNGFVIEIRTTLNSLSFL